MTVTRRFSRQPVQLGRSAYERLTALKRELETEKSREVTYTEAVEYLLDYRAAVLKMTEEASR